MAIFRNDQIIIRKPIIGIGCIHNFDLHNFIAILIISLHIIVFCEKKTNKETNYRIVHQFYDLFHHMMQHILLRKDQNIYFISGESNIYGVKIHAIGKAEIPYLVQ